MKATFFILGLYVHFLSTKATQTVCCGLWRKSTSYAIVSNVGIKILISSASRMNFSHAKLTTFIYELGNNLISIHQVIVCEQQMFFSCVSLAPWTAYVFLLLACLCFSSNMQVMNKNEMTAFYTTFFYFIEIVTKALFCYSGLFAPAC